jgi:hypothetical protein
MCYLVCNIIMNTQCIHHLPEAAGRKGSAVRLNILVMQCNLIYFHTHTMSQTTD